MELERDGRDWPNRAASRLVDAAGLRWHVQTMGQGPHLLLVHGTGASTHSWRDLMPLLAGHFCVTAPDLPGHAFTTAPPADRLTLPAMAADLAALLRALELRPALVVGHSAGAAILARMCLDGLIAPAALVSLNGALLPLRGLAGHLFAPLARLLVWSSVAARLFAWRAADPAVVERMMRDTGSTIDPAGLETYRRLARDPGHVAAALGMMAGWDLEALARELPGLATRLVLVVGGADRMVRPAQALQVRRLVRTAELVPLPGLGHLAHEERPAEVARLLLDLARRLGVLPQA